MHRLTPADTSALVVPEPSPADDLGPSSAAAPCRAARERLETPDGDFVDLDWLPRPAATRAAPAGPPRPRGLVDARTTSAGSSGRRAARGWRAVVLNFRSCSGELNRLPRFYHSGDTGDLDDVVRRARSRASPALRLGAVGVSIGGNVLLKWLGEQGDGRARGAGRGAVAISVPFDLAACARVLDRGSQRLLYTAQLPALDARRRSRAKAARVSRASSTSTPRWRARTFADYDRAVTAPLHGFADERDYWRRASSGPYLRAHPAADAAAQRARRSVRAAPRACPTRRTLPPAVRAEFVPARRPRRASSRGAGPWRRRPRGPSARAVEFLRRASLDTRRPSASMTAMPTDAYGLPVTTRVAATRSPPTIARCARCSAGRPTPSTLFRAATRARSGARARARRRRRLPLPRGALRGDEGGRPRRRGPRPSAQTERERRHVEALALWTAGKRGRRGARRCARTWRRIRAT